MKYHNTRTGAETDIFSDEDWKSGQPQRAGWVNTEDKPLKTAPKDIVDFVFKKKEPLSMEIAAPALEEVEILETEPEDAEEKFAKKISKPNPDPLILKVAETKLKNIPKQSKPKRNDNPKQKRPAAKHKS
jgi:hypothetical protein